jgi:hypothetical protein
LIAEHLRERHKLALLILVKAVVEGPLRIRGAAAARAERQPVWPSSQHQESRFFKSILRREVALGMKRTRHQLAPAVPMQEVVDRAVAGRMPDRFLVARLEIMDVQHLAGAGCFGKAREQGLFFRQRHVLVLAPAIRLGLERLEAGCVIPLSRNSTIWMRWRCATGIFHRSAVFSRRTSALLHLTICCPESDGASESHLGEGNSPDYLSKISIQAVMEVV